MQLLTYDPATKRDGMIPQPLYGTECWYVAAVPETSGSSGAWATKAVIVASVKGGSYKLSWRHNWRMSAANLQFQWRLRDGATVLATSNQRYMNTVESRNDSGFVIVTLAAGTHTISVDFLPVSGTAYMSNAYLEVVRFS
jgi:hypothetical protein